MFITKSIKRLKQIKEDEQNLVWLDATKKAITRTSPIRDRLAEAAINANPHANPQKANKHPERLLTPSAVSRPNTHLIPQNSSPGRLANPEKTPLQRAQYLILVEASRNLWIAKRQPAEGQPFLERLHSGLAAIDTSLAVTRPVKKGEISYEQWWRNASKKLSPKQAEDIQTTLNEVPTYFALNSSSQVAEPLSKSANLLNAQIGLARQPDKARGHIMLKAIQLVLLGGSWALNAQNKLSDKLQEWSDKCKETASMEIF